MWKLASVSEVKRGRTGGRGTRGATRGSGRSTAASTQSGERALAQTVTSARSCARASALFITLVCCAENSWAVRWSLTQWVLLSISWPGLLKKHWFGTKTHEIRFLKKDTHINMVSRVLGVLLSTGHTLWRARGDITPGFSHRVLLVIIIQKRFQKPPQLTLTPVHPLVSSLLSLQSSTYFHPIRHPTKPTPNKTFQNSDLSNKEEFGHSVRWYSSQEVIAWIQNPHRTRVVILSSVF